MAYGAKVLAFGILSCLLSFTCASPVIITNDGKEADAAKPFAEEIIVDTVLIITNKDQRQGRNKSEKVAADGATIKLKRERRSPQGPNRSFSYIPYNVLQSNFYQPFGFRPFQHQGGNGQNGNHQPFQNSGRPLNGFPNNGRPQNGYQNNGFPDANFPNSGYPQNGFPQNGNGFLQPNIPGPVRAESNYAGSQSNGFDASTPLGDFGGSNSNSLAQGFSVDENGIRGSVGIAANQEYRLPNGQKLVVNLADSFNTDNGNSNNAGSNSVVLTGPNGEFLESY